MRRTLRVVAASTILSIACLASVAAAQPRPEPPGRPPARGVYVFVGGYFWDMRFGAFPWWSRQAYPFPYFPAYATVADVRVMVTPKTTSVFVDGFYAGVADDFNGFFERLTLSPGGHEITLYLEGYRTESRRIYLSPGSTFKLEHTMALLPPDDESETPVQAPPVPPPPPGSFLPPRTPSRWLTPPPEPRETAPRDVGVLSLRVQPTNAQVTIDRKPWTSCDGERFVIELSAGAHWLEVTKPGYRPLALPIHLRAGETLPLNITLTRVYR